MLGLSKSPTIAYQSLFICSWACVKDSILPETSYAKSPTPSPTSFAKPMLDSNDVLSSRDMTLPSHRCRPVVHDAHRFFRRSPFEAPNTNPNSVAAAIVTPTAVVAIAVTIAVAIAIAVAFAVAIAVTTGVSTAIAVHATIAVPSSAVLHFGARSLTGPTRRDPWRCSSIMQPLLSLHIKQLSILAHHVASQDREIARLQHTVRTYQSIADNLNRDLKLQQRQNRALLLELSTPRALSPLLVVAPPFLPTEDDAKAFLPNQPPTPSVTSSEPIDVQMEEPPPRIEPQPSSTAKTGVSSQPNNPKPPNPQLIVDTDSSDDDSKPPTPKPSSPKPSTPISPTSEPPTLEPLTTVSDDRPWTVVTHKKSRRKPDHRSPPQNQPPKRARTTDRDQTPASPTNIPIATSSDSQLKTADEQLQQRSWFFNSDLRTSDV